MSLTYFLPKIARSILTLFIVLLFVFVVLRVTGDAAELLLPEDATEEEISYLRTLWGLDQPLGTQFTTYLSNVLQGEFGNSFRSRQPVSDMIQAAFWPTIFLMSLSLVFSIVISIPLGVFSATHHGTLADRVVMGISVFGFSMPDFFFGILLLLIFSFHLGVLPSAGSGTAAHLVMPLLTIGTSQIGSFSRFTRSAMLQTLSQPYIRTAKAKGASWRRVLYLHALPNAAIPIVTIIGTSIGQIVTGAVVAETVFAWPGLGRLLVRSVGFRDLPVVQGLVILISVSIIVAHLVVDVIYGFIDPRIRISGKKK